MPRPLTIALLVLVCASCGGGGGGGGGPKFAGTWDFEGFLVRDDCNTNAARAFAARWIVNQDGNRVVVQSGRVSMVGEVNDDDGYDVASQQPITLPNNPCQGAGAISTREVSGDEGAAVFAIGAACPGAPRICSVAYAGVIERVTTRSVSGSDGDEMELLLEHLTPFVLE